MSVLDSDFFFQAEDGIRDADVTGVQTCALPISINFPISLSIFQYPWSSVVVTSNKAPPVLAAGIVKPAGPIGTLMYSTVKCPPSVDAFVNSIFVFLFFKPPSSYPIGYNPV